MTTKNRAGFTLVELMVVIGMIGILITALGYSITGAQQRARVQKALGDVKAVTDAILGYENYAQGYELEMMTKVEADAKSLGFLLGKGGEARGAKIPVLLLASLQGNGKMVDPWGQPYYVTIKRGTTSSTGGGAVGLMRTGYMLPNLRHLTREERSE